DKSTVDFRIFLLDLVQEHVIQKTARVVAANCCTCNGNTTILEPGVRKAITCVVHIFTLDTIVASLVTNSLRQEASYPFAIGDGFEAERFIHFDCAGIRAQDIQLPVAVRLVNLIDPTHHLSNYTLASEFLGHCNSGKKISALMVQCHVSECCDMLIDSGNYEDFCIGTF